MKSFSIFLVFALVVIANVSAKPQPQPSCDDEIRAQAAADCATNHGAFNAQTCECTIQDQPPQPTDAPKPTEAPQPNPVCDDAMRRREAKACVMRRGAFNAQTCECTVQEQTPQPTTTEAPQPTKALQPKPSKPRGSRPKSSKGRQTKSEKRPGKRNQPVKPYSKKDKSNEK